MVGSDDLGGLSNLSDSVILWLYEQWSLTEMFQEVREKRYFNLKKQNLFGP